MAIGALLEYFDDLPDNDIETCDAVALNCVGLNYYSNRAELMLQLRSCTKRPEIQSILEKCDEQDITLILENHEIRKVLLNNQKQYYLMQVQKDEVTFRSTNRMDLIQRLANEVVTRYRKCLKGEKKECPNSI